MFVYRVCVACMHHTQDKTVLKFNSDSLQEDPVQDFRLLSKTVLQVFWEVQLGTA